jgi:hypothetical protein
MLIFTSNDWAPWLRERKWRQFFPHSCCHTRQERDSTLVVGDIHIHSAGETKRTSQELEESLRVDGPFRQREEEDNTT